MKTAISIPDKVFREADRLAKRLGLSRSELYVRAVARFLEHHRLEGITEALDEVYSHEDSSLPPRIAAAQASSVSDNKW